MLCLVAVILFCSSSFALNPNWQIYQYGHRAWKVEDGFLGGAVNSLAQDGDGYLWIGTDQGMFRFDGVRLTRWNPPDGSLLPTMILSLLAARDGSLWIGTNEGLVYWDHDHLTHYKDRQGTFVYSILQDEDGTVWFTPFQLKNDNDEALCKLAGPKMVCYVKNAGFPPLTPFITVVRDSLGNILLGGPESMVEWKDGLSKSFVPNVLKKNRQQSGIQSLVVDSDGSILVGMAKKGPGLGLQRFRDGKWSTVTAPGFDGSKHRIFRMFVDQQKALWIGT